MYRVIGSPRSRAMRVIWAMEELRLDYEIHVLPLGPAARAFHPEGKVPLLETPEGLLSDSVAIIAYLADKHRAEGAELLSAPGSYARGVEDGHAQFLSDELDGALWVMAKHRRILPEGLRAAEALLPAVEYELARGFERLAARVGDGPFLMGERFSAPDILAGQLGGWAKSAGFAIPEAAEAYFARAYARPSNARARARAQAALDAAGL